MSKKFIEYKKPLNLASKIFRNIFNFLAGIDFANIGVGIFGESMADILVKPVVDFIKEKKSYNNIKNNFHKQVNEYISNEKDKNDLIDLLGIIAKSEEKYDINEIKISKKYSKDLIDNFLNSINQFNVDDYLNSFDGFKNCNNAKTKELLIILTNDWLTILKEEAFKKIKLSDKMMVHFITEAICNETTDIKEQNKEISGQNKEILNLLYLILGQQHYPLMDYSIPEIRDNPYNYVLRKCPECGYDGAYIYYEKEDNEFFCSACGKRFDILQNDNALMKELKEYIKEQNDDVVERIINNNDSNMNLVIENMESFKGNMEKVLANQLTKEFFIEYQNKMIEMNRENNQMVTDNLEQNIIDNSNQNREEIVEIIFELSDSIKTTFKEYVDNLVDKLKGQNNENLSEQLELILESQKKSQNIIFNGINDLKNNQGTMIDCLFDLKSISKKMGLDFNDHFDKMEKTLLEIKAITENKSESISSAELMEILQNNRLSNNDENQRNQWNVDDTDEIRCPLCKDNHNFNEFYKEYPVDEAVCPTCGFKIRKEDICVFIVGQASTRIEEETETCRKDLIDLFRNNKGEIIKRGNKYYIERNSTSNNYLYLDLKNKDICGKAFSNNQNVKYVILDNITTLEGERGENPFQDWIFDKIIIRNSNCNIDNIDNLRSKIYKS